MRRKFKPLKPGRQYGLLAFLFLFTLQLAVAQTAITGKVTDEKGGALPGVVVLEKGISNGTTTDPNGNYSLPLANGNGTLVFSFIGYLSQEAQVNNRQAINVSLAMDVKALEEVVVIGYQTISKKDLTGAVSVVNSDDIKRISATTVAESLQGLASGVSVRSGGKPGQESSIVIRGIGNFSNNAPLYVIDGLITNSNRDFNPNDIASIQILKDASAAAIYGANAANGVVIITTKKGKEGPMKVSASAKYSTQQIPKRWDLADNVEYARMNTLAYANAGLPPLPSVSTEFDPNINTDWQEAIMKTGSVQEYNLNFSGGSKNGSYLIAGNYFNNEGTILGTSFDRVNFRVNTEGKKGIFRIGENFTVSSSHEDQMQGNPFYDMIRMLPVIPIYNPNNVGGFGYGSDKAYTFATNPVASNTLVQADQRNVRLLGNAYAEISPVKWLTYKFNVGLETNFGHFENLRKFGSWTYNQTVDPSRLTENRDQYLSKLVENTVNLNQAFGRHNLNGVLGTSYRVVSRELLSGSKQDVTQSSTGVYYPEINAAINNPLIEGFSTRFLTFSYLGRVNYDYAGRYLLSATFRRDADSRFGANYRHGNFPSLSAAWRLSSEKFFRAPWVSDLKLRASYGELGTSNIDPYERFGVINLFPIAVFGSGQTIQSGAIQTQLVNENIRWETKKTLNFGLDAALLNNKILFSAEYFITNTHDVLTPIPIPATTGNRGGNPFVNAASLKNSGIEFSAAYRNNDKAFKYDISANLSTVKNEVIELGNLGEGITYIATGLTRTQIGRPIGEYFLYRTDGLFQSEEEVVAHQAQPWAKPGDIRFVDTDGNGVLNAQDRTFAGSPWPKIQTGLTFNSSYRNFSLALQLYGVLGNKIYNSSRSIIDRFNDNSNYRSGIRPWTPENPDTDFPRISYSGETAIASNARGDSDRWLEDGSYVRLRQVELGYDIPQAILQKVRFTDTRIFVSGQNLLTFTRYTGLDPDVLGNGLYERGVDNGDYPANRTISAGIQFGF